MKSACNVQQSNEFRTSIVSSAPDVANAAAAASFTPTNKALDVENDSPNIGSSSNPPRTKLKDLPHTTTLKGCVAYVDVWSTDATDNRSAVFRNFLQRMGATVPVKFTKEQPITHLVFKDGHKSSLQKALKRNVKIVTCLWVDRCRVLQQWVSEDDFLFDPTDYKPPKRFREMQPLEPEEMLRRSAESLKRRKARLAKKNARIMFQSPLVTHCASANGTPKNGDSSMVAVTNTMKPTVLAVDTPFQLSRYAKYFSPSIVPETPMSDSMKRMMQRWKEGKRVFSPPTSDEDSEEEDDKVKTVTEDSGKKKMDPEFSPIPETQFLAGKTSWRTSGISPPKFDVSCDEVPETQMLPMTPENPDEPQLPPSTEGDKDYQATQHISELKEDLSDLPVFTSTAKENSSNLSTNVKSESILCGSTQNMNLAITPDNSEVEESSIPRPKIPDDEQTKKQQEEIAMRQFSTRKKRRRRLLAEEDFCEPISILISPQKSEEKRRKDRETMLLPQLGYSAFKDLKRGTGRYFSEIRSTSISECSDSSQSSESCSCGTQSSQCDDDNKFVEETQNLVTTLTLYDRVKMRKKRLSSALDLPDEVLSPVKSQKLNSGSRLTPRKSTQFLTQAAVSRNRVTPNKRTASFAADRRKSTQFLSQTAASIINDFKRRRSSHDFMSPGKNLNLRVKKPKEHIVLTNFHSDERQAAHQAIHRLTGFHINSSVRDDTTHVVCGDLKRTMNVLRAITRGLWLISKNWITDSVSAGFWLEEESYEILNIFPAAYKNRRCRLDDPTWRNELLADFIGSIHIYSDTKPSPSEMKELILLCGGQIASSTRCAALCIGMPKSSTYNKPVVREAWLLDSICDGSLKPVEHYAVPWP